MRRTLRRAQDKDTEEVEEMEDAPELSEKELKKRKRQESVEKRKNAKRKDKVARWGGIILLGLIMFIGFLLWVSGEMKSENKPTYQQTNEPTGTSRGSIIVR